MAKLTCDCVHITFFLQNTCLVTHSAIGLSYCWLHPVNLFTHVTMEIQLTLSKMKSRGDRS